MQTSLGTTDKSPWGVICLFYFLGAGNYPEKFSVFTLLQICENQKNYYLVRRQLSGSWQLSF